MKTITNSSLEVDAQLWRSAESVLQEGESLSSFVEEAIRQSIANREANREFIARGLESRERAKKTGRYIEAAAVLDRLQGMLDKAKSAKATF